MDWASIIIAVTAALGGGGVTALFLIKPNKRKATAEAKGEEQDNAMQVLEGWKQLAQERETKNHDYEQQLADDNIKIDKLYETISEWRDKFNEKCESVSQLKITIAKNEPKMCERRGCGTREPQSGY